MSYMLRLFVMLFIVMVVVACKKDDTTIGGTPSELGAVGAEYSSGSSAAGASNINAVVTSRNNGVSSFSGTAVVTSQAIKNILSNFPGTTIDGNNVTVDGVELKITNEGVESVTGMLPGILVKYDSKVGDTYPIPGTNKKRTVVSKSTDDDFSWAFWLIKVIKVEEPTNRLGVKKTTYIGNHKFGIVEIVYEMDDGSVVKFGII
jgi:hypothetical protein